MLVYLGAKSGDTVDGRNPAPVDRWFIPLFIGVQPSKVVQDFFHPQYLILLDMDHGYGGVLFHGGTLSTMLTWGSPELGSVLSPMAWSIGISLHRRKMQNALGNHWQ